MKHFCYTANRREKICTGLYVLLLTGVLLLYLLFILGILPHHAKIFAWILFAISIFVSSFGQWNRNRERAVGELGIGIFVSVVALIGFLFFLMTT